MAIINNLTVKLKNLYDFAAERLEGNLQDAFLGWYAEKMDYLRSQRDEITLAAILNS